MLNIYTGLLKMMDDFQDDGTDVTIKYLLDADYQELSRAYNLYNVAGNEDDFNKAANLLKWISSNIHHYGNYDNHVKHTAMDLFEYSFGKGSQKGINCSSLSVALTECLLAIGLKARTIFIMPFSPYDFDNHVVCEVWIKTLNKWVMFDPTYNLCVFHNNEPLNVLELRKLLADKEDVTFNNDANYNGDPINKDEVIEYYAKDLFYFMFSDIQGSDSDNISGRRYIHVAPIGYDTKKANLANIDYRIKERGASEDLLNWRKNTEIGKVIYKGLTVLY
jgi:transglutaminase-like putative cysteine protease